MMNKPQTKGRILCHDLFLYFAGPVPSCWFFITVVELEINNLIAGRRIERKIYNSNIDHYKNSKLTPAKIVVNQVVKRDTVATARSFRGRLDLFKSTVF